MLAVNDTRKDQFFRFGKTVASMHWLSVFFISSNRERVEAH